MRILLILLLTLNLLNAKKIALLIGNSDYHKKILSNPTNDIDLLAEKLSDTKIGFTVYKRPNLSKSQMIEELRKFYNRIDGNTIALIYFSGHGVHSTIDDKNYLIPIGGFSSLLNEAQLSDVAVSDSYLLGSTNGAKFSILLLDACRSNDFAKVRGDKGLGLPQSSLANDYVISYATKEGKTAEDGYTNSPYALALSHHLLGNHPIEDLFRKVRREVMSKTSNKQEPLYKPSFNERLCLTGYCQEKAVVVDNSQELARLRAENARYREQSSRVVVPEPEPISVVTSTSKWLKPTNSTCTNNSGKMVNGVCRANWENAKKICSASGGSLPTIDALRKVVTDCGGVIDDYKNNRNNSNYQTCYKQRGFTSNYYWSSTEEDSSGAWVVSFGNGSDSWSIKSNNFYALCVR
jgi:hypothetical protein